MDRGSTQPGSDPPRWGLIGQYILAYIVWFAFCALSFWTIWLVRTNLVEDIFFLRVNPWQLRAIDRWSIWLMGAGWLVGVFCAEGYLRSSVKKGRFLFNSGKLFLIPAIIIALSFLVHAI